jgi:hypothetical protein
LEIVSGNKYAVAVTLAVILIFDATAQSSAALTSLSEFERRPARAFSSEPRATQWNRTDGGSISVDYVMTSKTIVGYGYPVNITELVKNAGETQTFNLTTYYNSIPLKTHTLALAAISNTTVKFSWIPSIEDVGQYTIWATVPGDVCIGDSVYVSIPGDIDANGMVNIVDIVSIAKAYGSSAGHPRYDVDCDINGDGTINIQDISAAARNFGKSWNIPDNIISISATSPHVADGFDASAVNVDVKDRNGSSVLKANVIVFARAGIDWATVCATEELSGGKYLAQMTSTCSGGYALIGYDRFGNSNNTVVTFVHSPTTSMDLTATYNVSGIEPTATIKACATDAHGNIVEDANITFVTDFGTITSIHESLGVYTAVLTSDDWGTATVTATDKKSNVFKSTQVEFSPACLEVTQGLPDDENFTVPVYVYAPSKNGYLFFYSMNIFFNSSIVKLTVITDGDPTDGFPTPNATVKDSNTIMIYQANQIETAYENVHVANLTFTPLLEDQTCLIGILPPEIYLKTIQEGVPHIWFQEVPNPPPAKQKPTVKYKAKVWRPSKDGKPVVSDDEVKKRMEAMEETFKKNTDSCALPFKIKIEYTIENIDWELWKKTIDKTEPKRRDGYDDGKLDGPERKRMMLSEDFYDTGVDINIYLGFVLKDCNGIDQKADDRAAVFSTEEGTNHPYYKYLLPHEVIHRLSGERVVDLNEKDAEKQGAKKDQNLFNSANFCQGPDKCKLGGDLTEEQGKLVGDGAKEQNKWNPK